MGFVVVAARHSVAADRRSEPESPVHRWAFPGCDCKLAFDLGHWVDMAWSYWHCRRFEREGGDTGSWVLGEWVVEGEEVYLGCLGSVGAEGWQGEGAVVEVDSSGAGLPFQALGGAVQNKGGRPEREIDMYTFEI